MTKEESERNVEGMNAVRDAAAEFLSARQTFVDARVRSTNAVTALLRALDAQKLTRPVSIRLSDTHTLFIDSGDTPNIRITRVV